MNIELNTLSSFDASLELIIIPVSPKEISSEVDEKKQPAITKGPKKGVKSDAKESVNLLAKLTPETRDFVEELNKESNGELLKRLKKIEFSPSNNERVDISLLVKGELLALRLSGLPKEAFSLKETSIDSWRKLGGDAARSAKKLKLKSLAISLRGVSTELLKDVVQAVSEGILLSAYEFSRYKSAAKKVNSSSLNVSLLIRERANKVVLDAVKSAKDLVEGVTLARDLVNTPAVDMLPKDIVLAAKQLKSSIKRSKLNIYAESDLKRMKANLILCVSAGSISKPFLIHMTLPARSAGSKATGNKVKKVVLVGKGVSFDSGGLCIKPGKSMEDMKCDMAGAAAVLGTMKSFANSERTDIELHIVIPTTENSISGPSVRPGDIVKSMNGKTVEVLNTDAEGRLILADAFTYVEKLKPDIMIDLATLTGACIVALGDDYAGLFTNDKVLRDDILEAGKNGGELYWPLPLAKEYKSQIKGQVGDLRNIGAGSGAGATIGALFLEEFVPKNTRWAHLDIAGPAFLSKGGDYSVAGATGFGVRTLVNFLENL